MTIKEALYSSISFSVSSKQAEMVSITRGLDIDAEFTPGVAISRDFQLCKADLMRLALTHPNVSEGGVSISFSDRRLLLSEANAIYRKYNEPVIVEQRPTVEPLDW